MAATDGQLRISVSLSGGASLGAYHAGVLGALTTALQAVQEDDRGPRLDAIGGASAGALASMFAVHGLLNGLDTAEVLYQAWVEQVSLDMLRERGAESPLGFRRLRDLLPGELDVDRWSKAPCGPQSTPIGLHVSLTGLRGLRYEVETTDHRVIPAITYADWGEFVLEPGGGVRQLLEPEGASVLDFVLASAANPAGFGPELLDRTGDREAFASRNIEDLPGGGRLWYTDGSSISSEPIGRVLTLLDRVDEGARQARRIHLMVDTLSEIPDEQTAWTADAERPTWLKSLSRTLEIMPEQILQDDLRRVQHVNHRFERLDQLVEVLAPRLDADAVTALHEVFDDEGLPSSPDADAASALARSSAGSPGCTASRLSTSTSCRRCCWRTATTATCRTCCPVRSWATSAGSPIGACGAATFALGYECLLAWLPDGLARVDVDDHLIATAIDAVEQGRRAEWSQVEMGRAGVSDLPSRSRLALLRLGLHTPRVIGNDIWRIARG